MRAVVDPIIVFSDPQVCRLHPNYDVYVSNTEMRDLMRQPSATSLVRTAMRAVFTIDARTKCSVSGKASPSRLGVIEIRTPLHPDGVEAILGSFSPLIFFLMRRNSFYFVISTVSVVNSCLSSFCRLCEVESSPESLA